MLFSSRRRRHLPHLPNLAFLSTSYKRSETQAAAEAQLKESQDRSLHTASQCIAVIVLLGLRGAAGKLPRALA